MGAFSGGGGDNLIDGSGRADAIDFSQGGDDTLTVGGGGDFMIGGFGALGALPTCQSRLADRCSRVKREPWA